MASAEHEPLDSYDLSNPSYLSPPRTQSPVHGRHPYRRQGSSETPEIRYHNAPTDDLEAGGEDRTRIGSTERGLGISNHARTSPDSVHRVAVGSRPETRRATSMGARISPEVSNAAISQATTAQNTQEGRGAIKTVEWDLSEDRRQSSQSFHPSPQVGFSDTDMLNEDRSPNMTASGHPDFPCPTDKAIVTSRWSWLTVSILILAVYSTIFSAIFLGIALARPRWGKKIGTNGHMSSSTASLLSALFSKTVELSFVTVFVAFLGQVLSRRAFQRRTRYGGITIAEMTMRTWIMQPGTLITHWEAVRYAATTVLGAIALTAAFMAIFYTTAAEALVAPKLRFGRPEYTLMGGKVEATFANPPYLADNCPTPIQNNADPTDKGITCLQIEHAGQAFHNFQSYLDGWGENIAIGNTSDINYVGRPNPVAIMFDNTTVQGQWITPSHENITADSLKYKRFVQNVTMAMPHANVLNAARDPLNNILQPQDLQGNGEYYVEASVPAPTINILCAGMTAEELAPLVYITWPNSGGTFNMTTWPTDPPNNTVILPAYPNATVVDDLFGFGPERGQRAPIFPKYPMAYNTMVNGTEVWPANAIYILATPPPNVVTAPYLLCSMKAMQYPNCTTRFHAAQSGGQLSVHCDDDPQNSIPYAKSQPLAHSGNWESDWKNVGAEWANSVSLGAGIADGQAAIARILTQMTPAYNNVTYATALDPALPSIGEALGVLTGCTLLLSSLNSPFIHFWNYSTEYSTLEIPQYQMFNASLMYEDYASGRSQPWQGMFYIVLVAVFLTNVFCLCYLIWGFRGDGQVTDYTEPQNLFALAVNSPPSRSLSGACGAGPEGDVLGKKWQVDMQRHTSGGRGHPHFYVRCPDDERTNAFGRLRQRKARMNMSDFEDFDVNESPAVEQYMKLATSRHSVL